MDPNVNKSFDFFSEFHFINHFKFTKGTFTKQSSNLDEQMNQVFAECDAVGHILPNIEEKLTKVITYFSNFDNEFDLKRAFEHEFHYNFMFFFFEMRFSFCDTN